MNGKINSKIVELLRNNEFKQITNYISKICDLLVENFIDENRKFPNDENQMRSILLVEYLSNDEIRKLYGMLDYDFIPEVPENYDGNGEFIGRTDIRIKLKTDFDKRDAYYIVECKRIDGTSNLNKKYLNDGVIRFITKKYSSYYKKNIMLGFVVRKIDIHDNVKKIENIQNSGDNFNMYGEFLTINEENNIYDCIYKTDNGDLEIRHIFADFSRIME